MEFILLQAGGGWTDALAGTWPLLAIVAVFYFFIIRPQSQRQKEQDGFIENLKNGQTVVTSGGIHGKITKVKDTTIELEIANKTYIILQKTHLSLELSQALNKKD